MRGFNRAIIAGNLARDPDVRTTVNKRSYARFAVAVNYRYKDQNGEIKDSVDYINVVIWGALAESCGKYLRKGSPVLVEGRIQTSSYDAKDGSGKRYMTEINADNILFLGSNQQSTGTTPSGAVNANNNANGDGDDFGKSIDESGFSNTPPPEAMSDIDNLPGGMFPF
ncbi:MAG: single-stranded DNA-binding protein [Synergistaceae bacterium]|nr:single-stranded DNA-binding protein [Synergistaceae bacterium]